jgi:hypothetical protein
VQVTEYMVEVQGYKVHIVNNKVIIVDQHNNLVRRQSDAIAQYLMDEGFVKKDFVRVEIMRTNFFFDD